MAYCFSKKLGVLDFDTAVAETTAALKKEGFGVLTEIDITKAFKDKLNVDFKKYKILGACNPHFAHKALLAEDKLGVFLPCNVVVEELEDGGIEIAAVNPIASMMSVENEKLSELAIEIELKMKRVIESI